MMSRGMASTTHEHQVIFLEPHLITILHIGLLMFEQVKVQGVMLIIVRRFMVIFILIFFHELHMLVGVNKEHGGEEYQMSHVMALSHFYSIQWF